MRLSSLSNHSIDFIPFPHHAGSFALPFALEDREAASKGKPRSGKLAREKNTTQPTTTPQRTGRRIHQSDQFTMAFFGKLRLSKAATLMLFFALIMGMMHTSVASELEVRKHLGVVR
jgi:hypothetical protein